MTLHYLESLYWVITMKCNDHCDHCYNNSGPRGETLDIGDLLKVVPHLPDSIGRIILSGGEPTVELSKLEAVVKALKNKYGKQQEVWLQSNGDLINDRRLERILASGITRIDIVSIDRYHRYQGSHQERLRRLFKQYEMVDAKDPCIQYEHRESPVRYAFWGATEDLWLQGNWARGRALINNEARMDPTHNVCSLWSGAKGFLEHNSAVQEVHIQLYRLYPCCPTTLYALGDVRYESVSEILKRAQRDSAYTTLNEGAIYDLGIASGLSHDYIQQRMQTLGNVCLWCDEFFAEHYTGDCKGERRASDPQLTRIGKRSALAS